MKITYDHFHGSIPQNVREKIGAIAQLAYDDLISEYNDYGGESYGCPNLDEIYGYDPGGFIPFQHGGFQVTELYRHDIDSSYHITEGQTISASETEKHLYQCFASDHSDELKAAGIDTDADDFDRDSYTIPESIQDLFSEYENEFWEPALMRFCIFVSKPNSDIWGETEGPRKIELSLSLNYSDAPYYREKHDDDTLATLSYDLEEFMTLDNDAILSEFKTRIQQFFKTEKE